MIKEHYKTLLVLALDENKNLQLRIQEAQDTINRCDDRIHELEDACRESDRLLVKSETERVQLTNKIRNLEYTIAQTRPEFKNPLNVPQIKEAMDALEGQIKIRTDHGENAPVPNFITAIKVVREFTGMGLKEAKDWVEDNSKYLDYRILRDPNLKRALDEAYNEYFPERPWLNQGDEVHTAVHLITGSIGMNTDRCIAWVENWLKEQAGTK
jgi:hypothetical protein